MEADNDNKMEVESTYISVDEVKKEPLEVADYVDEQMLMERINADADVKSDPEAAGTSSDDDDKTMLEGSFLVATWTSSKNTGLTEGSSDHLVDNKVTIGETYVTKSELPKEERILYCEICRAEFEGYCMKCPMISHILDNTNVATDGWSPHDTIPGDVLQFKDSTPGLGVFAIKAIPKDVAFGPFDGLESVSSTTGWAWKLRDGKPIPNKENFNTSNWMQFINCAEDIIERNLDVYQCEDRLYYRSVSEISEGEELLVHFDEEHLTSVDSETEKYFSPVVEKSTENIYACIFCCLGFKTEAHLIKHKTVCPYGKKEDMTTEGIVQCTFCKIYLEQKELSENHVSHCRDKSARSAAREVKIFKCYVCFKTYQTGSLLVRHQTSHDDHQTYPDNHKSFKRGESPLEVSTPMKGNIWTNIKNQLRRHLDEGNRYQCAKCCFGTKEKDNLRIHLLTHRDAKPFKCGKCSFKAKFQCRLARHLLTHSDAKPFACGKCSFKTKTKNYLHKHLLTHSNVKPFACGKCCRCKYSEV